MKIISVLTSTGSSVPVCIVKETGKITLETCEAQVKAMVSCSQQQGCDLFLMDLTDSEFVASIANQFNFAYQRAEKLGLKRSWKIALWVPPSDEYDFLEVVSQNAGYRLKHFDHQSAAMNWLVN